MPAAKSPCPATTARTVALLIVFLEILLERRLLSHVADEPLVERLRGIGARISQQMVHCDDLRDDRDVLSWIEWNRDLGDRHVQDLHRHAVESRAVDDRLGVPLLELDDDLDPLLL